jgi:Putative stress-responsive transcriptional regulator
MKKVINVGIGGRSFAIDEDAYQRLTHYLNSFKQSSKMGYDVKEVMEDLESRIAELFTEDLNPYKNVVDLALVNKVISQLGMPNGEPFSDNIYQQDDIRQDAFNSSYGRVEKKLYRDANERVLGGICSGLSHYFDIDRVLVRVLFIIAFLFAFGGGLVYIILWIVVPKAITPTQRCEMYGLPVTAENLKKFSNK